MQLTAEQQAILDLARETNDSFIIDAKAGSGKTSTLLELMASSLRGTTLYLAFNRSIVEEVKPKAAAKLSFEAGINTSICTVHSHGLSAFRRAGLKPRTLDGKLSFMLKDMLELEAERGDDIWRNTSKVSRLVGFAKGAGFGLTSIHEPFPSIHDRDAWLALADHYRLEEDLVGATTIEEIIDYAIPLLQQSNARTNSIDFDDMIYLPLLHNLPLPTYDNVLIDEAQDINATRREMAFRSVTARGRIIAVGDPNQAIYGFTGADSESLSNIGKRINADSRLRQGGDCRIMGLSICWRCDGRIIEEAQKLVPEIKCRPGAEAEGQVVRIPFICKDETDSKDLFDLAQPGDAILCRLNKPNVATCLGFMRRGMRAKIEGRDLGKRLEYHYTRAAETYAFHPLVDTILDLDAYREREIGKMVAKNRSESTIALFEDELDATRLIAERCIEVNRAAGWAEFQRLVADLFGDNVSNKATITLSSVHKAKGREWPRVFILGRDSYMPFHLAEADWELTQENNLIYVAITRAERQLFYVTGVQSAIDKGLHREVRAPSIVPQPPGNTLQPRLGEKFEAFQERATNRMEDGPEFLRQSVHQSPTTNALDAFRRGQSKDSSND